MGIIRWMCAEGDTQVAWDETDTASMERAREMVERAFREGRGVFGIDSDGVGTRLHTFDPAVREIVEIPQVQGGSSEVRSETPEDRADRLMRDVLGDDRCARLHQDGYLDIPSGLVPGRTYRLDSLANLSYRDPGDTRFSTTLCIQPLESVPRGDLVAMRYLLVTADERRLLQVANPISFGLVSLVRTVYGDFRHRRPAWQSALYTFALFALFLGSVAAEVWVGLVLLPESAYAAVALMVVLLAPALVGLFILVGGLAELWRGGRRLRARLLTRV
ncbi:MAG TPA: hypothetical protein VFU47_13245 [Armatimonadota bacterium]|nr:hypothetical protein [Armatimonadota bacterium]